MPEILALAGCLPIMLGRQGMNPKKSILVDLVCKKNASGFPVQPCGDLKMSNDDAGNLIMQCTWYFLPLAAWALAQQTLPDMFDKCSKDLLKLLFSVLCPSMDEARQLFHRLNLWDAPLFNFDDLWATASFTDADFKAEHSLAKVKDFVGVQIPRFRIILYQELAAKNVTLPPPGCSKLDMPSSPCHLHVIDPRDCMMIGRCIHPQKARMDKDKTALTDSMFSVCMQEEVCMYACRKKALCCAQPPTWLTMLLLLLLSVLTSQTVAQYDMTEFQQVSPHEDTGFYASTLQHIWHKYNSYQGSAPGTFGDRLTERKRNPKMRAFYFYLIFVYIHKLPQRNWLESYKSSNGKYKCGRSTFDREVFPMASALADIIEEIDYTWRLDPHNHALPPFDKYITGIVDTCPVPLACPNNFHLASLFFQVSLR